LQDLAQSLKAKGRFGDWVTGHRFQELRVAKEWGHKSPTTWDALSPIDSAEMMAFEEVTAIMTAYERMHYEDNPPKRSK